MEQKEAENVLKYFFEAGHLKYSKRTGWWIAKVKDPESIAEHSFRTAVVALVLAIKEKHANPEKLACSALLHDLHETRLLDRHKIFTNYLKIPSLENKVIKEQSALLGKDTDKTLKLISHYEDKIVRDADLLECAITAREYFDAGYKDAWSWIERVDKALKTKTAKQLCTLLKKTDSNTWWQGLKEEIK